MRMKKWVPIFQCHKCPFFNLIGLDADASGAVVYIKGTCIFYCGKEIEQETPIKPSWCKVNEVTAEEEE